MDEQMPMKLQAARLKVSYSQPFFGALLYGIDCLPIDDRTRHIAGGCKTMCTDGKAIYYDEEFVEAHSVEHLMGVIVHEIWHMVLKHIERLHNVMKKAKDKNEERAIQAKFNIAGDLTVNPLVLEGGFALPAQNTLHSNEYVNKSLEQIVKELPDPPSCGGGGGGGKPQSGSGSSSGDGSMYSEEGVGDFFVPDGATDAEIEKMAEEMENSVRQAAHAAKARGVVPAQVEQLIKDWDETKIDWRSRLWRACDSHGGWRQEETYRKPNRRYLPHGFFIPSIRTYGPGVVAVALDTSASVSNEEIKACFSEVNGILADVQPETTYLIQCDADIKGEPDVFENGEELPTEYKVRGRGGTDFAPPFRWLESKQIVPNYMIYLTDGECPFPDDPGFPVIWVITNKRITAPWGTTIHLSV